MLSSVSNQGSTLATSLGKGLSQGHDSKFSSIINSLVGGGQAATPKGVASSSATPASRSAKSQTRNQGVSDTGSNRAQEEAASQDAAAAEAPAPRSVSRDSGPDASRDTSRDASQAPPSNPASTPTVAKDPAPDPSQTPAQTAQAAAATAQPAEAQAEAQVVLDAMEASGIAAGAAGGSEPMPVPGDPKPIRGVDAPIPDLPTVPIPKSAENADTSPSVTPTTPPGTSLAKGFADPIAEVPTPIKPQGPEQAPTVSGDAAPQPPTDPPATDAATQAAGAAAVDLAATNRASVRRQTSPVPQDEGDLAAAPIPDAQTGTPALRTQDPVTSKGSLTPAQAKVALDLAVPGVKLQTRTTATADAQAAPAKPALTELLNQPKPEVETPRILTPGTAEFTALHGATTAATPQASAAPAPAPLPAATGADSALAMAAPAIAPGTRVPAPAAVLETPAAAQHSSLVSQVDGSIKWLLKNQNQSAELQLHPESLGTVRIKLSVEGTEVHARIWASDPAAVPTLHENRAFLEASLREQGLTLGSFNLQQGRQGEQTPQSSPASVAVSSSPVLSVVGQETPTALAPLPSDAHRIEIVA